MSWLKTKLISIPYWDLQQSLRCKTRPTGSQCYAQTKMTLSTPPEPSISQQVCYKCNYNEMLTRKTLNVKVSYFLDGFVVLKFNHIQKTGLSNVRSTLQMQLHRDYHKKNSKCHLSIKNRSLQCNPSKSRSTLQST